RRHTRSTRDWSSDVCSSDLPQNPLTVVTASEVLVEQAGDRPGIEVTEARQAARRELVLQHGPELVAQPCRGGADEAALGRGEVGGGQPSGKRAQIGRASCRERGEEAGAWGR